MQNENTSITELIRELDITQTPKKEVKKVVLIQDKKDKDKDKKKRNHNVKAWTALKIYKAY